MLSSPLYRPRLALLLGETMEVSSARSSDRRGRSVTAWYRLPPFQPMTEAAIRFQSEPVGVQAH